MSVKLPPALARYFAATNRHDVDGMLAVFGERAVVEDEGRAYAGTAAIRQWMRETIEKYDFTVEPTDVAERDGKTIVTGVVTGNFPGSPVSLDHAFTLEDANIVHLEIG